MEVPRAPIHEVAVIARLEDIVDFPDAVEQVFGLRVREEVPIPLPSECGSCDCADLIDLLQPAVEGFSFSERETSMQITATISMGNPWDAMACMP